MTGRINTGACQLCSRPPDENDHDPCLGTLPGVMNACCGHGGESEPYVQFQPGPIRRLFMRLGIARPRRFSGHSALVYFVHAGRAVPGFLPAPMRPIKTGRPGE